MKRSAMFLCVVLAVAVPVCMNSGIASAGIYGPMTVRAVPKAAKPADRPVDEKACFTALLRDPNAIAKPGAAASPGVAPAPSAAPFVLPPRSRLHLGDIAVSVERATAQAMAGRGGQTGNVRWSAADELRLLLTHGALHVCGWDHAERTEEAAMRAMERRLLGDVPA